MKALEGLFLEELAIRYDSEQQQVEGLSKIAAAATCPHLRKLLLAHHGETESHVEKLERVFHALGVEVKGAACETTVVLLRASDHSATTHHGSPGLNAMLIACAQKIEHQEIAAYGCLREWALLLGNKETTGLLEELHDQEKAANQSLIKLARFRCNKEALGETAHTFSSSDRFGHEIVQSAA